MTNTAITGFVQGKKYATIVKKSVCKELGDAIDDRRSDSLTPSLAEAPHTVGAGAILGKDAYANVALSRLSALRNSKAKKTRFIEPLTYKQMGKPINMCGTAYTFPQAGRSSLGTHAEARIISKAAGAGTLSGSALFLNVDWRNTTGKSKMPCELCHDLICTTMKNCGTQIYMCDKNNDAIDMEDYCDNNSGTKDAGLRSKLEDRLNIDMRKGDKPKKTISVSIGKK